MFQLSFGLNHSIGTSASCGNSSYLNFKLMFYIYFIDCFFNIVYCSTINNFSTNIHFSCIIHFDSTLCLIRMVSLNFLLIIPIFECLPVCIVIDIHTPSASYSIDQKGGWLRYKYHPCLDSPNWLYIHHLGIMHQYIHIILTYGDKYFDQFDKIICQC